MDYIPAPQEPQQDQASHSPHREVPTPHREVPTPRLTDVTEDASRLPGFEGHKHVYRIEEPLTGLHAYIAIHDITLGPAVGGTRMWPYSAPDEAITDVLRLSQGMTRKAAMAGLPCGGGKAVIVGDSHGDKSESLFRAFGKALDMLGGRFVTGEDVGVTVADVDAMRLETRHALGGSAGGGGDPSPMTAYGVHIGIKAAVHHRLRRSGLAGISVAVQGLGKVGFSLCERLHADGARLVVADIDSVAAQCARERFDAEVVGVEDILRADADVFAPCALGQVLDDDTIPTLKAVVVAGSANNQLSENRHGRMLMDYGILYAPDYVINAGGVIAVAAELAPGGYNHGRVARVTGGIGDTLAQIFARADRDRAPTNEIADRIARERIEGRRIEEENLEEERGEGQAIAR